MHVSILLAHPTPGSLNHAIAKTARAFFVERGDDVRFHDLYAESFDPILPGQEIERDAELPADIRCVLSDHISAR